MRVTAAFGPSDGLLYVWNGAQVLKQNAIDSASFTSIGNVGSGSADAGPIAFSRDASRLLLGNGAGGFVGGANCGPDLRHSRHRRKQRRGDRRRRVSQFVPGRAARASRTTSSSSIRATHASPPAASRCSINLTGTNVPVIENIPGASTSMAIGGGRLYVGVGFGPSSRRASQLRDLARSTRPIPTPRQSIGRPARCSTRWTTTAARACSSTPADFCSWAAPTVSRYSTRRDTSRLYDNQGFTSVDYDPFQIGFS